MPFIVDELRADVDPFLLPIYAALGEKERSLISRRTKEALAARKAQGVRLGNPSTLRKAQAKGRKAAASRADQHAANVLPVIQSIQTSGISSYGSIAKALNARGIRTARGGQWHPATVRNIMLRAQET